jgi:hypothetical protein
VTSVIIVRAPFCDTDPFNWTTDNVMAWITYYSIKYGLNVEDRKNFCMDGIELCSLSESDFLSRGHPKLYAVLDIWKTGMLSLTPPAEHD